MITSLKEFLTGKHRQSHRHVDPRQQQQHTSLASKLLYYLVVIKQHETVPTVQSVHHCHGQKTPKILV